MSSFDSLRGIPGPAYNKIAAFIEDRIKEIHTCLEQCIKLDDIRVEQGRIKELRLMKKQIEYYSKGGK